MLQFGWKIIVLIRQRKLIQYTILRCLCERIDDHSDSELEIMLHTNKKVNIGEQLVLDMDEEDWDDEPAPAPVQVHVDPVVKPVTIFVVSAEWLQTVKFSLYTLKN